MSWEGEPTPIEALTPGTVAVHSGGHRRKRQGLASVDFFTTYQQPLSLQTLNTSARLRGRPRR